MATLDVSPVTADPRTQLQTVDPNFDPDHFLEFAEMAFFLVKKALQDRDPTGARAFVGDAVYQQLQTEIEQIKASRRVLVLDGLWVKGVRLLQVGAEPGWFFIAVAFQAAATPYYTDDTTGQRMEGATEEQDIPETWTFARAESAKSKIGGGVMEYKCPNCGAPFALSQLGVCGHCGAPVASGQFDWIVTEMTR